MKRTRILAIAVFALGLGLASAASAATMTLQTDKPTYLIGETITLVVNVAQADETDNGITGVVLFNTALMDPSAGGATQTALISPGGFTWTQGALATFCQNTAGTCRMFSQAGPVTPASVSSPASPFVLSTKTFTATALGTATFNWLVSPASPVAQRLDYFGLTSAPGVTVQIIPEPTTAALLGIGLFGLAVAGRRRA